MVTNACLTSQKHYKAKRREDASVRQMLRTVTQKMKPVLNWLASGCRVKLVAQSVLH